MSTSEAALRRPRRRKPERKPSFDAARLPPHELFGIALQGLRVRRLRAALSALGPGFTASCAILRGME